MNKDGRKIKSEYEHPLDNLMISISQYLNPIWKKYNFTPNHLTTLSLLFSLICAYCINNDKKIYAIIFLLISYLFDCNDGNYARTYGLETKFGDKYDHYSDILKLIFLMYYIVKKNPMIIKKYGPTLLILYITTGMHIGCQQKKYNNNLDEGLNIFKKICFLENYMQYTRWFSCGSIILYNCFLIYIM